MKEMVGEGMAVGIGVGTSVGATDGIGLAMLVKARFGLGAGACVGEEFGKFPEISSGARGIASTRVALGIGSFVDSGAVGAT